MNIRHARYHGHSHVLVEKAAVRGAPFILKFIKRKPRYLARRIAGKHCVQQLISRPPPKATSRVLKPDSIGVSKSSSGIGMVANAMPSTSFSVPPQKKRRIVKALGIIDQIGCLGRLEFDFLC